jgi:hypothetical protein
MNPVMLLLQSRKFLLLVLDSVVSSIVMILTHVLAPDMLVYALGFVTVWQAVFVSVINGIAKEDSAKIAAGILPPAKIS